jgi:hypothetical protein
MAEVGKPLPSMYKALGSILSGEVREWKGLWEGTESKQDRS